MNLKDLIERNVPEIKSIHSDNLRGQQSVAYELNDGSLFEAWFTEIGKIAIYDHNNDEKIEIDGFLI